MVITNVLVSVTIIFLFGRYFSSETDDYQHCEFRTAAAFARTMFCRNFTNEDVLEEEINRATRSNIKTLIIEHSTIRFFHHGSFKKSKLSKISIVNSSILSLSDTDIAFEGLEGRLRFLSVQGASYVSHWDWNHLRFLKKLNTLSVVDSDLIYVSDDLGKLSSDTLRFVNFAGNGITWVHEEAFAGLRKLETLNLSRNDIDGFKRTMFPRPANLETLDFSYNQLSSLERDIFDDMPKLWSISLAGNQLRTMDERTFNDIWVQLRVFAFSENPLRCDCRLKWITKHKSVPILTDAICKSPHDLEGRWITSLKSDELWC